MSIPPSGNEFLHELECDLKEELTLAEAGRGQQEEEDEDDLLTAEGLPDPDDKRYEASLRSVLGAIESLEEVPLDRADPGLSGQFPPPPAGEEGIS